MLQLNLQLCSREESSGIKAEKCLNTKVLGDFSSIMEENYNILRLPASKIGSNQENVSLSLHSTECTLSTIYWSYGWQLVHMGLCAAEGTIRCSFMILRASLELLCKKAASSH